MLDFLVNVKQKKLILPDKLFIRLTVGQNTDAI